MPSNVEAKFSADRIVELLVKVHTGTLDDGERADLSAWLEACERNRALYRRLSDNRHMQEQYDLYKISGHSDGWEELKKRMAITVRRNKRNMIAMQVARWGSAAAIVVAVVVSSVFWLGGYLSDANDNSNAVELIVPGRNEAVIEFATGEKIILDENRDHSIRMLSEVGTISGDSILRYEANAKPGKRIYEKHTLRVPKGAGTKLVILSDGSRVWLNAGSSITYPVQFYGPERQVDISGECYFDIANDTGHPFVVETQGVKIRVMGTQFNVMSYPEDNNVETTLVSGRVSLSASNKEVLLKPGVQAVYNRENGDIALRDVDPRIYTAWKEGIFEFDHMTIENICHVLSRWYDVEFVFEDHKVRSISFFGTMKRDKPLAFILDRISDTKTISYKMEDGKVIVMKK